MSPSKYDAVLPKLRPRPVEDQAWQDKVDKQKAEMRPPGSTVTPTDLARAYAEVRALQDIAKAKLSEIQLRCSALEQLLVESQDDDEEGWGQYGVGENALRMQDGSTIRVQTEISPKILDHDAFRLWCMANGYERKLRLMPQTAAAVVKERLLMGLPEPTGVEAYRFSKIVFTPFKGSPDAT